MLGQVGPEQRFAFHEACRMRAIELAARLGMRAKLSLNVIAQRRGRPGAVLPQRDGRCGALRLPVEQLMFELARANGCPKPARPGGVVQDLQVLRLHLGHRRLRRCLCGLRAAGGFQPDIVKVDMSLVRGVDADPVRLAIVRGFVQTCGELRVRVVAEGIETREELARAARHRRRSCSRSYLFSRPVIASLPPIAWGTPSDEAHAHEPARPDPAR